MNRFDLLALKNSKYSILKDTDNYITDDGLFYYSINENNEIIIDSYVGSNSTVNVPASINGLPVRFIGEVAFCENYNIRLVNLPEVKEILPYAFFGCLSLEKIYMPKVTRIGEGSLIDCLLSEGITTSEVTIIESYAFVESNIKSIDLPKIISIGDEAFYPSFDLSTITISKNIAQIGDKVFTNSPITSVTIDYGTEDITNVTLEDWNLFTSKLTGLDVSAVTGKYIKNNVSIKNLTSLPSTPPTEIYCSNIVAYNLLNLIVKWKLLDESGNTIYTSGRYLQFETWIKTLSVLNKPEGYHLKLKAAFVAHSDKISNIDIIYSPTGGTAYFEVSGFGLNYVGYAASNNKPPILPCSKVVAYDAAFLTTKWGLFTTTGTKLFESGNNFEYDTCNINLNDLGVQYGTELYLKALVKSGNDSISYITLKYIPESNIAANFSLKGIAFKNITCYEGTTTLEASDDDMNHCV